MTKIRTTESHLNADQTHFEGAPLSPVIGPSGTPLFAPQPEPELSTTAVSPSTILESQVTPPTPPLLDKIVEGDEETIPVEPFPAIRFADQEGHHQPTGTGIGLEEIDSKLAPLEGSSPSNRTHPPTTAGSLSGIRAPLPTAEPTPAVEMKKPIFDSFPDMQGGLGGLRKPSGRASSDASLSTKMEGADGNNPQERTRTGLLGSVSEERELTADTGKEKHLYKVDLSADGPVEERGDDDMKGKGKGKGIVNVVADKVQALVSKIGVADSLPQPTTFEDSNVKAGQPAVDHVIHIAESSNETNDSGKSTGRDEESALVGGKLKKRQGGVIERPRSAQSLRPTTEDGGKVSRSWLSSIWRTVIVGWLGGFWKKLFGRGRTQSRPVTPVSATRNG